MRPVCLAGVPRSGTTWLGALFDSSPSVRFCTQPLFSYAFKGAVDERSSAEDIRRFFGELEQTDDPYVRYGTALEPQHGFGKAALTHLVIKETRYLHVVENLVEQVPELRVIPIVRNPLAVLASWRLAPKEWQADWDWESEWRTGRSKNAGQVENFYGFEAWKTTTAAFVSLEERFPDRVRLTLYRDLLQDPRGELRGLFEFVGLEWTGQTEEFLGASRSRDDADPYGVYRVARTRDDKWKGQLPPETVKTVREDLANSRLVRFLD